LPLSFPYLYLSDNGDSEPSCAEQGGVAEVELKSSNRKGNVSPDDGDDSVVSPRRINQGRARG